MNADPFEVAIEELSRLREDVNDALHVLLEPGSGASYQTVRYLEGLLYLIASRIDNLRSRRATPPRSRGPASPRIRP